MERERPKEQELDKMSRDELMDLVQNLERDLTAFAEASYDGVWEWFPQDDYEYMSPRFWETFGYDPLTKEPKPSAWRDLIHPDDLKVVLESFDKHVKSRGKEPYQQEVRFRHKDGHWVTVLRRGRVVEWGPQGDPLRMIGTHTDVTHLMKRNEHLDSEVAKATDDLYKKTKTLEDTFDSLKDGVLVISPQGELIMWNKAGAELVGAGTINDKFGAWSKDFGCFYPDKETLYPEKDLPAVRALSGEVVTGEKMFIRNSTRPEGVLLSVNARPICDQEGQSFGAVVVMEDITEKVKNKEKIENQRKQILHSAKLASIGELAAGVGHEINNPLSILVGSASQLSDMVKKSGFFDEAFQKWFDTHKRAADRISGIVNGLRTFARSDDDHFSRMDVVDAVRQTVGMIDEIYAKENINLSVQVPLKPAFIEGNMGRFQQVLMNLLSNAKDAVQDLSGRKEIFLEVFREDQRVKLKVRDNGHGIPKVLQEKIFESFFSTKENGKGTGMGLGISAAIVNEHRGSISCDSQPGEGTVFALDFPEMEVERAKSSKNSSLGKNSDGFDARILIVDDEPDVREILQISLENYGCVVDQACDGEEALSLLQENTYDIIFTDLKMPKKDGFDLIRNIHQMDMSSHPKIIAITGGVRYDGDSFKREELLKSINGFLIKPFEDAKIRKILGKYLKECESLAAA